MMAYLHTIDDLDGGIGELEETGKIDAYQVELLCLLLALVERLEDMTAAMREVAYEIHTLHS